MIQKRQSINQQSKIGLKRKETPLHFCQADVNTGNPVGLGSTFTELTKTRIQMLFILMACRVVPPNYAHQMPSGLPR